MHSREHARTSSGRTSVAIHSEIHARWMLPSCSGRSHTLHRPRVSMGRVPSFASGGKGDLFALSNALVA